MRTRAAWGIGVGLAIAGVVASAPARAEGVVVAAKDANGQEVRDVAVYVDGRLVATTIEGHALVLAAGPHELRFERAGSRPVFEYVVLEAGGNDRVVSIAFKPAEEPSGAGPTARDRVRLWVPLGLLVEGTLAVATGVTLLALTPSTPANCDGATLRCTPSVGESASQFVSDQNAAGKAHSMPVVAGAVIAEGAAMMVAAVIVRLAIPAKPSTTGLAPWVDTRSAGLSAHAAF
jgi:hypothetical protein